MWGKKPTATRTWAKMSTCLQLQERKGEEDKHDDANVRETYSTPGSKPPALRNPMLSVIHSRDTFHNPLAEPFLIFGDFTANPSPLSLIYT